MKKIFTLFSVAMMAISANAQEVIDISSAEVKEKIEESIANPVVLNNPLFIMVEQSEKVFPAGTYVTGNYEAVTGGTAIGLKNYSWEYSTENVTLKANSTLNADAADNNESWQFKIKAKEDGSYVGTAALNVEGCSPQFLDYVQPKTGNPSAAYKDFYEYPCAKDYDEQGNEIDKIDENGNYVSDETGDPIHRILEPVWEPGDGDLPAKGCYYEFTCKKDGVLTIALSLNKNLANNKLYIIDESTKDKGYLALSGDKLTIKGFRNGNTFETESDRGTTNLVDWTLQDDYLITTANLSNGGTNRAFFGYVSFDVKAGVTYMALSPKSQLGLFGCSFSASTTGIESIKNTIANTNATIYNLAGQKVSDNFKGIVVKEGRKMIQK